MTIFKLIRPLNLLLIAMMQLIVVFGLFKPLGIALALNSIQFILLIVATLAIAAGGNIINDVYDVDIDTINHPKKVLIGSKISERKAMQWYVVLNVVGVSLGFYLSNFIERPGFATIFIFISALLYVYASFVKGILIVGNILISVLVAFSIIIVGLFELFPLISIDNQTSYSTMFKLLLEYALFAFLINFIREIVKDIEDINGDKNGGMNTLPIVIGRKRASEVVFVLGAITTVVLLIYMYIYLYNSQLMILYFLIFSIAPLLFFCTKAWGAEKPKDYKILSNLLKLILFFGMCSLLLYPITNL